MEAPHAGLSYNPSYEAHQELLNAAHGIELKREADAEAWRPKKERMEAMKHAFGDDEDNSIARFRGMAIDNPEEGQDDNNGDSASQSAVVPSKSVPARKTRQQKLKTARLRAEVRITQSSVISINHLVTLRNTYSLKKLAKGD